MLEKFAVISGCTQSKLMVVLEGVRVLVVFLGFGFGFLGGCCCLLCWGGGFGVLGGLGSDLVDGRGVKVATAYGKAPSRA